MLRAEDMQSVEEGIRGSADGLDREDLGLGGIDLKTDGSRLRLELAEGMERLLQGTNNDNIIQICSDDASLKCVTSGAQDWLKSKREEQRAYWVTLDNTLAVHERA